MEKVKKRSSPKSTAQALRNSGKQKLQKFRLGIHLLTEDEKALAIRLRQIMDSMIEKWDANTKQIVDAAASSKDATEQ